MNGEFLKQTIVKERDNVFVMPKVGTMKADVRAFLSDELFEMAGANMWEQAYKTASYEGVVASYLMPDCHAGAGIPIGSVVVTDGTIIMSASGYDISCGVCYTKAKGIGVNGVKSKELRRRWIEEVEKRISSGAGSKKAKLSKSITETKMEEILRFGGRAINVQADVCEREYIPIDSGIDLRSNERAFESAVNQLASVGGGNHFIEMQADRDTGEVYVMIHCGSRGFGYKTADHFFRKVASQKNIPTNRREESWVRLDEEIGREYWNHHNAAANFAIANRHAIVDAVSEAFRIVFKADLEVYYEISHNLVQEETIVLPDGTRSTGFVHRKGATRAFPAGHASLRGSTWEHTGHPCCIPGSMYDGAAILFAGPNSSMSGFSVNHGSGRVLARGEAKRRLSHKQQFINDEMNDVVRSFNGTKVEGIISNHRNIPIDECKHVYKDLDVVLATLEDLKIATVAHRMYPIANIKGAD